MRDVLIEVLERHFPFRRGTEGSAAMAADHGDHVTPDQFKGRAR